MPRLEYFADAWYFIALLDRFDAHHQQARRLRLLTRNVRVITHDAVLMEVLAYFAGGGTQARQEAVQGVRRAMTSLDVVPSSGLVFQRALDLYEHRLDKEYSLVDCMSMVLMRDRGITHVLTNDHHFSQDGFTIVNQ